MQSLRRAPMSLSLFQRSLVNTSVRKMINTGKALKKPKKRKTAQQCSSDLTHDELMSLQYGPTILSRNIEQTASKKRTKALKELLLSSQQDVARNKDSRVPNLTEINESILKSGREKSKPKSKPKDDCKVNGTKVDPKEDAKPMISPKDSVLEVPFPFERQDNHVRLDLQSDTEILRISLDWTTRRSKPSVSKILDVSMSDENRTILKQWEARMIEKLGEAGFKEYKAKTFSRGKAIHAWLESYLLHGERLNPADIGDEVTECHVRSIDPVLGKIKGARVLESAVTHEQLNYCGIVDCVARLGSDLCLIDWKTSEKTKPNIQSLYDNPLQLVAYIGALNSDPNYKSLGSVGSGAIIVIYNSGFSANIHRIPARQLEKFWSAWLKRINIFREKTSASHE